MIVLKGALNIYNFIVELKQLEAHVTCTVW